jgi:hypothetical protein
MLGGSTSCLRAIVMAYPALLRKSEKLAHLAIEVGNLEMWRIVGCEISVDRLAEAIHLGQFFMMDSFLDVLLATKSLEFTPGLCEAIANVKNDEVEFLDRVLGLAPRDCLDTIWTLTEEGSRIGDRVWDLSEAQAEVSDKPP